MPRPALTTGVEQSYTPASHWIASECLSSFEAIAHPAGEPEVLFVIRAATRLRDNVVDLQQSKDVLLLALTIPTTVAGLSTNARSEFI